MLLTVITLPTISLMLILFRVYWAHTIANGTEFMGVCYIVGQWWQLLCPEVARRKYITLIGGIIYCIFTNTFKINAVDICYWTLYSASCRFCSMRFFFFCFSEFHNNAWLFSWTLTIVWDMPNSPTFREPTVLPWSAYLQENWCNFIGDIHNSCIWEWLYEYRTWYTLCSDHTSSSGESPTNKPRNENPFRNHSLFQFECK